MGDDAVLVDIEDATATLTLNRPDTRNALTGEISREIVEAIERVEDSDARCVVLEGAGESFSAGGDVTAMLEGLHGDITPQAKIAAIEGTAAGIRAVYECDLPVVGKVDGPAFGAGANLAIACDVPVASEDATVSFGFRQVGLAVDAGTSYLLPRIVGENKAQELVLTGEVLDAEAAADLGIVAQVHPAGEFEAAVAELTDRIATGPTVALATSKRLLRQGLDSTFEQAIENEAAAQVPVFETHDHEEGATAFLEGREPEFEGR